MDIEEEIIVTYLLIRRMRKRRKKECLEKSWLGDCFKKEKRKVLTYFFIISGSASSSWILHLLVFPTIFCENFSCLILFIKPFSMNLQIKKIL